MPKKKQETILVGHIDCDPAELPENIRHVPGRDPDAPRRVSDAVEVSDDRALIRWTRQAYEADLDHRFPLAVERVRSGEWVYLEQIDALRQRPRQAGKELRSIVNDKNAPPRGRARAAEVLVKLGQSKGADFLNKALRSRSSELCAAAADVLGDSGHAVDLGEPFLAASVLRLLDSTDPEIVEKAVRVCRWKRILGAEKALQEALANGREPREELADALASLATTRKSTKLAVPHLFQKKPERFSNKAFYFRRTLRHPKASVREPLRQALRAHVLHYTDEDVRLGQHWAGDIAEVAEVADLEVLDWIVANAKDPVSRAYSLEALARLQPEEAVTRLLAEIQRGRKWRMLVDTLAKHSDESDFARIAKVLYPAKSRKAQTFGREDVRLLLDALGQPGEKLVRDNLARLDKEAREYAAWKLQGLDTKAALTEMRKAGIIPLPANRIIARMKSRRTPEDDPLDLTEPWTLFEALGQAGIVTGFDTETGMIPCHHEELIRHFADHTEGKFAPECPVQIWPRHGDDDYESPYTIQFVYEKRLYRFAAENFGDYYDVESVVRALNFALETNGQPERFIGLHTGDQTAAFVYADPDKFVPLAEKYHLPLADRPDEGMRAGRAFEQQVMQNLDR